MQSLKLVIFIGLYKYMFLLLVLLDYQYLPFIYSLIQGDYFVRSFLASDLKQNNGTCRFQMSSSIPYTQLSQFGLPKGGKYNQIITNTVQYLWETGLISYWASKTIPKISEKCISGSDKKEAAVAPIKTVDLISAFLILGIGIGVSVLAFLLELIYFKWQHQP